MNESKFLSGIETVAQDGNGREILLIEDTNATLGSIASILLENKRDFLDLNARLKAEMGSEGTHIFNQNLTFASLASLTLDLSEIADAQTKVFNSILRMANINISSILDLAEDKIGVMYKTGSSFNNSAAGFGWGGPTVWHSADEINSETPVLVNGVRKLYIPIVTNEY